MNYIVLNKKNEWEPLRLYDFKKFRDEVYYRTAVLETNTNIKFHLADMPLPNGILRVDKVVSDTATEIRLGHYALPKLNTPIQTATRKVKGYTVTIIDNGEYQLALIPLRDWQSAKAIATINVHPQSKESMVINATQQLNPKKECVFVTLMLWKKSGEEWSEEELVPVTNVKVSAAEALVKFKINGSNRSLSWE
jgi:hypothetical protein